MNIEITTHKVAGLNDRLTIRALDEPAQDRANNLYEIQFGDRSMRIPFQNGPVPEVGVNGVSIESLLAVVADRLNGFQKGAYACLENAQALSHIVAAIAALHARTTSRMARGVEGKQVP